MAMVMASTSQTTMDQVSENLHFIVTHYMFYSASFLPSLDTFGWISNSLKFCTNFSCCILMYTTIAISIPYSPFFLLLSIVFFFNSSNYS
ncbi:hypothetical protein GDO81_017345 [Engystomops pustulosus]|uniref:Uncharacterized protein n=1 Tax=Engystomops pustulosus TaxID=76066 RepID=A0AAV7AD27_ENGPU|nr:hypothetical protein GDO81_017345 [Engystomops pustulosus]